MRDAVTRYLDQRRYLGYKDEDLRRDLLNFVDFSEAHGLDYIMVDVAIAWVGQRNCRSDTSRLFLLSCIRRLALYLKSEDDRHEILSEEYAGRRRKLNRSIPFIFSDTELRCLMLRISELSSVNTKAR